MAGKQRRKLSLKGAKRLMWTIVAIYAIFMATIVIMEAGDDWFLNILVALGGGLAVSMVSYIVLVEPRKREEDYERLETEIRQHLSSGEFRQVYLRERYTGSDYNEMIKQIMKAEGCQFLVKLITKGTIQLAVRDKHEEEVYSAKINNFIYFDNYFKFEE